MRPYELGHLVETIRCFFRQDGIGPAKVVKSGNPIQSPTDTDYASHRLVENTRHHVIGVDVRIEGVDGEKGDFDRIQTKMIYLDGFSDISNRSKKVVGIKLDVENYEYHVLEGAKNLIQTDRPAIYAELWDNENRQKCFELMKNMNYETYSFEGKKMIAFNKTNYKGQNFVFLPK